MKQKASYFSLRSRRRMYSGCISSGFTYSLITSMKACNEFVIIFLKNVIRRSEMANGGGIYPFP